MQSWHVKLEGTANTRPKEIPEMTCKLQPNALMCFQRVNTVPQHPSLGLCPAPGSKHERDSSSCPSCLSSTPSTPGRKMDAAG